MDTTNQAALSAEEIATSITRLAAVREALHEGQASISGRDCDTDVAQHISNVLAALQAAPAAPVDDFTRCLHEYCANPAAHDGHCACYLLAASEAAPAAAAWIPVAPDSMPFEYQAVLVAKRDKLGGFFVLRRTFIWSKEKGWQRLTVVGGVPDGEITHWQPLPTPPQA